MKIHNSQFSIKIHQLWVGNESPLEIFFITFICLISTGYHRQYQLTNYIAILQGISHNIVLCTRTYVYVHVHMYVRAYPLTPYYVQYAFSIKKQLMLTCPPFCMETIFLIIFLPYFNFKCYSILFLCFRIN